MLGEGAPPWRSIIERLRDVAARSPDAVAIEGAAGHLTYRQVVAEVEKRAALIDDRLADGERLVAVCLERTLDLPVWLLAILRARAAYLPLDATLPPARTAQVLEGAKPALIVASRSCLSALPPTAMPLMVAEDLAAEPMPAVALPNGSAPDDLAYVMYTSGSTGHPKGVEIEHGAITALIDAITRKPGLAPGERIMGLTRISFDLSVLEMFLPLAVGARLVLISLADAADPRRLAELMKRYRPDIIQATPASYRALLEGGWPDFSPPCLLCGGEALTSDLAARLLPCCGALWNVYGPTETTVWSTAHHVTSTAAPIAIGRPIDGTIVSILDERLSPVADGETGEIVIGGPGVARGYRGAPDLTASRFVTSEDGSRAYRTGDIGRRGDDGLLYCLGRLDDQVKVRGFRVELGDIENALAEHPGIAWCAVRVWPDADGEAALAGYVVSRGGSVAPATLAAFLRKRLPPYMIPSRFIAMTQLPQTPSGKIDRKALPSPFAAVIDPVVPTPSSTINILAAIWRDILSLTDVGTEDDFFDLGGYSLLTVRLQRRIEERFGRVLDLPALMQAPTLRGMAALVDGDDAAASDGVMLLDGAGTRPPLFWLDAGPLMREMARAMDDQPVSTLNMTRVDEEEFKNGPLDLAAVAAVLRKRLVKAQPHGSCYVGGWCRWGVVAHELACQLRERGRPVGLLVLLDAEAPRPAFAPFSRLRQLLGPRRPISAEAPSFSQRVELAARHHPARIFPGHTLLIRPIDARLNSGGWRSHVAGTLTIEGVAGDHQSMVRRPHVAALGGAIERHLLAAQTSQRATPTRGQRAPAPGQAPVMPR